MIVELFEIIKKLFQRTEPEAVSNFVNCWDFEWILPNVHQWNYWVCIYCLLQRHDCRFYNLSPFISPIVCPSSQPKTSILAEINICHLLSHQPLFVSCESYLGNRNQPLNYLFLKAGAVCCELSDNNSLYIRLIGTLNRHRRWVSWWWHPSDWWWWWYYWWDYCSCCVFIRKGVGKALLSRVFKEAETRDIHNIYTFVRIDNKV